MFILRSGEKCVMFYEDVFYEDMLDTYVVFGLNVADNSDAQNSKQTISFPSSIQLVRLPFLCRAVART